MSQDPGRQQPARPARRSPTGWTTSPASAGPCCARCPASRPSAPGGRPRATSACRCSSGGPTSATCSPSTTSGSRTRATCAPPPSRAASRTWWRCSATSPRPGLGGHRDPGRGAHARRIPAEPLVIPAGMQLSSVATAGRAVADLRGRTTAAASPGPRPCRSRSLPAARSPLGPDGDAAVRAAGRAGQRHRRGRPAAARGQRLRRPGRQLVAGHGGQRHAGAGPGHRRDQHAGRVLREHPGARRRPPTGCSARPARPPSGTAARPSAASRSSSAPARASRSTCLLPSGGSHPATPSCSTAAPAPSALAVVTGTAEVLWAVPYPVRPACPCRTRRTSSSRTPCSPSPPRTAPCSSRPTRPRSRSGTDLPTWARSPGSPRPAWRACR